jgi:hypothetical protein
MGHREWGVLLRSRNDVRDALEVVQRHNQQEQRYGQAWAEWSEAGRAGSEPDDIVGETLNVNSFLRFHGQVYVCRNSGGGSLTSAFLHQHLPPHIEVLWPFDKPEGRRDCDDYIDVPPNEISVNAVVCSSAPRRRRRRRWRTARAAVGRLAHAQHVLAAMPAASPYQPPRFGKRAWDHGRRQRGRPPDPAAHGPPDCRPRACGHGRLRRQLQAAQRGH